MCVLLLRGSQTVGELRDRAARFCDFSGLEEVEATLNALIAREPEALVIRLPRQQGQKEARFAHLLSGEVSIESLAEIEPSPGARTRSGTERVLQLEQEVEAIKAEVKTLQEQFEDFKRQFE